MDCITSRVKHKVNCRLWKIIMCQCRFIFGKKKKNAILASDVDDRKSHACVKSGDEWKISANLTANIKLL